MAREIAATRGGRLPEPLDPRVDSARRTIGLTLELARTQFRLKYTGSVLGYAWSLLSPFFLFGINYIVFIYVLKVGGKEFGTQLLIGIVLWTFFAEATNAATSSIASSGHLLRKAAFPRIVLVVASTVTALVTLIINLTLVLLVTAMIGHLHPGLRSLAAIPLVIELYVLAMGIGLILASIFVFFRDVGHLWTILSQLLFYGSAIIFPFSIIVKNASEPKVGFLSRLAPYLVGVNPVGQIIEDMRRALVIDDADLPWMASVVGVYYVIPIALTIALFAVGALIFRRLSPRFAESL